MRLLLRTELYGNTWTAIAAPYDQTRFLVPPAFSGRECMLRMECKGFEYGYGAQLSEWLRANVAGSDGHHLPEELLSIASLDDFLLPEQTDQWTSYLHESFTAQEFHEFSRKHLPALQEQLAAAFSQSDESKKTKQLAALTPFLRAVFAVLSEWHNALTNEETTRQERIDSAKFQQALSKENDAFTFVQFAKTLTHPPTIEKVLLYATQLLCKRADAATQVHKFLSLVLNAERTRGAMSPQHWQLLRPYVRKENSAPRATPIDLSEFHEVRAGLDWTLWNGFSVGRIVPGRVCLSHFDREELNYRFIEGDRWLYARVRKAGGTLMHHGHTLLLPAEQTLMERLLLAETLDTLAHLHPSRALAEAQLTHNERLNKLATQAQSSPSYALVLADELIQRATGLDPDVARRMFREESAARKTP